MNQRTRQLLLSISRPFRLNSLIRWSGLGSFFPFYHTVSSRPLPHISHLYHLLDPLEFERDLDQLLQLFEPLSLEAYLEQADEMRNKRAMVLTFDDGLAGCHELIAPILRRKGIPAVFFLNNKFIDNRKLFYRYKASLLVDQLRNDCRSRELTAAFLKIPQEQVEASVLMINYHQRALLDALAREVELDFSVYLRAKPVYMSSSEVEDLLKWGFEIGAHSSDHADFALLDPADMLHQVRTSIKDLQQRFGIPTAYFSFPFTSDGVPGTVIDKLLEEGTASSLLGSAGLKRTGKSAFIQRIPMEEYPSTAQQAVKAEFFYYLLKRAAGRSRYRY